MTDFDMNAFIATADEASTPSGSYGLVYETWQNDKSGIALDLIKRLVPADRQDEAEAALRAKGIICDLWVPGPDECCHGLDAMTYPCGCFEGDNGTEYPETELPEEILAEGREELSEIRKKADAEMRFLNRHW